MSDYIIGEDGICGACGKLDESCIYVLEYIEKDGWLPVCDERCAEKVVRNLGRDFAITRNEINGGDSPDAL